ncbi:unnamed protein product [Caenorhabditis sp. 36 PRJEB53466]|nr:unnamed protein product [Caenorhabditis sp. 36 PRJEB53466]
MPPGEPVATDPEHDEDFDRFLNKKKYRSKFISSDWFVEPLLNFDADNSAMEPVYEAVKYWTQIAKELKEVNYPIAEGIDNFTKFDSETRLKARMLDDFLDLLITPSLFTEDKGFEVLQVLIAQGDQYLDFTQKMADVDFSLKCNTIWENDAVAYRCNTCALTPCMSLCEACFDANGHAGHDYTRFFSREGGACDCGNQDVIRKQGNCPNHGDESKRPKYDMSDVCLAEHIVTKLLVRLFLSCRGWYARYKEEEAAYHDEIVEPGARRPVYDLGLFTEKEAAKPNKVIDFLQECSNYGGPMRLIVAEVLLNRELYRALTEKTGDHYDETGRVEVSLDWRTRLSFYDDRKSMMIDPRYAHDFPLVRSVEGTECFSLLDELIFWICRLLFPQNIVNFGLSMLSEPGYRDAFALRFFAWYPLCGKVISDLCASQAVHSRDDDRVSPACSRAVHVTVQMLSSASLCDELNKSVHLVRTIFDVTRFLVCQKLTESNLSLRPDDIFVRNFWPRRSDWNVMKMSGNTAVSQHGYWFVMGDIQNVLTHTALAVGAVLDDECFGKSYMKGMCQMQGMNHLERIVEGDANERDIGEEVQRAYTLEFETLAVTLFNIVAAIQEENSVLAACRFFDHVKANLEKWFVHLCPFNNNRTEVWGSIERAQMYVVSFHIPLHRHMSTALTHFMELDGFYEYVYENLICDEAFIRLLILHPLRIQVARAEINCGMWVRNGGQARMSSLIYSQWNVTSAFQTPDVDLIRFCAAHIDKEYFVRVLTLAFNVIEKTVYNSGLPPIFTPEPALKLFAGLVIARNPTIRQLIKSQELDVFCDWQVDQKLAYDNLIRYVTEKPLMIEALMQNMPDAFCEKVELDENKKKMLIDYTIGTCSRTVLSFPAHNNARSDSLYARLREQLPGIVPDGIHPEREEFVRMLNSKFRTYEGETKPREAILFQSEWIDPMYWGMFKLVAELIVIRVNSGATPEEHYRAEMVNCMAMGNVSYSRLRASISEKGSRGSELIDKHFERILNEIGDFREPNEASNYLQQGSYQLKTSVWDTELCPVFFLMRSTTTKQAREVFSKMEIRERKNAVATGAFPDNDNLRHQGIASIYSILLTERFIINCISVLYMDQEYSTAFHEATVQMAVFMLTLGVKYASEYDGPEDVKQYVKNVYHKPFTLVRFDKEEQYTVCSFMAGLVEKEARKKDSFVPLFRNILAGKYDEKKITGGRMIYLARFLTILAKLSSACRVIIEEKLKDELDLISRKSRQDTKTKQADPAKEEMKKLAKARMAAIMEKTAARSARTMEKLMKSEGMTPEELGSVDPSQQNRKVYECPICGESDAPNTVENPFGMLAKLSTNFLCEEQIDANCEPYENLLDIDPETMSSFHRWSLEVDPPLTGTDLKTCGHTAHMTCFNAYRASLYDGRQRTTERREVGCPLCRYTVNIIVPMMLDKPYVPLKTPPSPLSHSDVWKTMKTMVTKARMPAFDVDPKHNPCLVETYIRQDERNVRHAAVYSTRDGGGLSEVWSGRQQSADWTERKSSRESCTVSTVMVSMAATMVERSSLLRKMGVPERRKNARKSLTEHIMAATVATSKDVDFDVTVSAVTSLLAKVSETPNMSEAPVMSLTERLSSSRASTSSSLNPPEEVDGLTATEVIAMALKHTRKRVAEEDNDHNKVPLFMLEPKTTLVRILSVLIDNQGVTKEVQQDIARSLISAAICWVTARTILSIVLRLHEQKIRSLAVGELKFDGISEEWQLIAQNVASSLVRNTDFFNLLMRYMASPVTEPNDSEIGKTIEIVLIDYLRFASELLFHCNLGSLADVECIHDPKIGLGDAMSLMNIKTDDFQLPSKASYWTLMYRPSLTWMSQLANVVSEGLIQNLILTGGFFDGAHD